MAPRSISFVFAAVVRAVWMSAAVKGVPTRATSVSVISAAPVGCPAGNLPAAMNRFTDRSWYREVIVTP